MNIKLASAMLFCSVVLSCSISEGQLLDRMLSRVGCSACSNASACDTGCDSGCGGEILSGGCGAVDSCGCNNGPGILDKIKGRLAQVGCGGGCASAVPASCGCIEPVVESCGCDAAPSCGGRLGLLDKLKGRLSSMGNGCGCAAPAADCGCDVAPVIAAPCGCDAPRVGLLDKLKGRMSSMGGCAAPVGDCGCDFAPVVTPCAAPVASPCGFDVAPSCGGGLLDRLKGRMSSIGGGGCGCAAPVADDCGCAPAPMPCVAPVMAAPCGCDAAPVSDCGCNRGGGRIRGTLGKVRGSLGNLQGRRSSCGCEAAPSCGCDAAPACGCESTCGATSGRLSLLDRLRGNRISRDRSGRVLGGGCNDGCNPPCPTSGCGCGSSVMAASGCSSCGGDQVIYGAVPATSTYSGDNSIMETTSPVITTEPAAEGIIEAPAAEGADSPSVDPNAFIIRSGNVRG